MHILWLYRVGVFCSSGLSQQKVPIGWFEALSDGVSKQWEILGQVVQISAPSNNNNGLWVWIDWAVLLALVTVLGTETRLCKSLIFLTSVICSKWLTLTVTNSINLTHLDTVFLYSYI